VSRLIGHGDFPTPVPQPVESSIQMGMIVPHGTKITLTINGEVQHYVAA